MKKIKKDQNLLLLVFIYIYICIYIVYIFIYIYIYYYYYYILLLFIKLGTTSLFFISHKGELLSSLKFDSTPTNFYLYPVYKGRNIYYMIQIIFIQLYICIIILINIYII